MNWKLFNIALDYSLAPTGQINFRGWHHQTLIKNKLWVELPLLNILIHDIAVVCCIQSVQIAIIMIPLIKKFGYFFDFFLSFLKNFLQLFFADYRNPIYFFYLVNCWCAHCAARDRLLGYDQKWDFV